MRARRALAALAALAVVLGLGPCALAAAPGDLDPGFDVDGRRTFGYGGDDRAVDVAVLRDGRILTAGWTTVNRDVAVTRLSPRGVLDRRFGEAGTADLNLGGDDRANALALQRDGAIVVAGRTSRRAGDVAVLRLRPDGSLDTRFGVGGVAVVGTPRSDAAYDVAVQPDGRIVVAGDGGEGADMAVFRLRRDGALDRGFGVRGRAAVDLGGIEIASAVALQRDGRIVIAGSTTVGDDIAVARLNRDGTPDRRFGRRGRATIDGGGAEEAAAVAVGRDGRIVVAGSTSVGRDMLVARLRPGGAPDRAFGRRGLRRVGFGGDDLAFDLGLRRDGGMVIAGRGGPGQAMAVARLRPGGALDPSFGRGGRATVDFAGNRDTALALAPARDGRIVLAGSSDVQVAVARLLG